MADPSAAISGSQGPSIDAILGASNKNISTLLGRESAMAKDETAQLQGIDQREARDQAATDRQMAGVKVPTLPNDATKPFQPPPQTDPKAVWASTAMLMAGLGSLLTRQPLTTAMNAAAGVIKAYRDGDVAAAQSAFTQWKAAQDAALKIANFQQDTYRNLIDQLRDMRDATGRDAEAKRRDVMAQYNAQGVALQDQVAAQEKSADEAIRVFDARQGWAKTLQLNGGKIEEQNALQQSIVKLQQSPKFKDALRQDQLDGGHRSLDMIGQLQQSHQMNPDQQDHVAESIVKDIGKNPVYTGWAAARTGIEEMQQIQAHPELVRQGIISQAVIADKFTQAFNGGRAIRGFQMKMNTDHAGLMDRAQQAANLLRAGGQLSQAQVRDMVDAAKLSFEALDKEMGKVISNAQARGRAYGLDEDRIDTLRPDDYDPNYVAAVEGGGDHPAPTPEARAYLKAHPETKAQFDEMYGPGSSDAGQ
jgi:hypothetical protein